ncbi:MAG: AgmX/PglI C-terminal domain-containing protein [Bdellovibrionales bacterium]
MGPKNEMTEEKDEIHEVIKAHAIEVSDCYVPAVRKNPKLKGKLVLEWLVGDGGDVKKVKTISGVEPTLDQCIKEKSVLWQFPPPPQGQLTKVRYPFIFEPKKEPKKQAALPLKAAAAAGPGIPEKKSEAKTEAPKPSAVPSGKLCPQIEKEYAELCVREENSGECQLSEDQLKGILRLLQDSAQLPGPYMTELEPLLKPVKPTAAEAGALAAHLNMDCWTEIHSRIWKSIIYTFSKTPEHPMKADAKLVARQRLVDLDVPNPTSMALLSDTETLDQLIKAKVLDVGGQARKDFKFILSRAKSLSKSGKTSWQKADPSAITKVARKEVKDVTALRAKMKAWAKRFWKRF